jgi:iron-sulfur cluster repair protein YtfE (RIC family)
MGQTELYKKLGRCWKSARPARTVAVRGSGIARRFAPPSARPLSEAMRELGQFRTAPEQHFRLEEDFMFPSFEAFTRALGGPTAAMRDEHRELTRLLDVIEGLLGDERPIDEIGASFEALLETHNAREEQGLYPLFERHAPAEAYSALDRELRALGAGTK